MTIGLFSHQIWWRSVEQLIKGNVVANRGGYVVFWLTSDANSISMKFGVDIIFRTGSCLIIQSYSPCGTDSTERANHVGFCHASSST